MTAARARLHADIERVARGDRGALRDVYQATSAKLLGICLHVLHDRALAEDVLQEVYLKVWQGAGSFAPERGSPMTWLCTLARNTAIDWRRAIGRREDAAAALPTDTSAGWTGAAHDSARDLHRCIETLDDEQRSSIRSAFFDGFTYAELAERVRVPLGTMKSWIRRGLVRLRECIENG